MNETTTSSVVQGTRLDQEVNPEKIDRVLERLGLYYGPVDPFEKDSKLEPPEVTTEDQVFRLALNVAELMRLHDQLVDQHFKLARHVEELEADLGEVRSRIRSHGGRNDA